MTVEEWLGAGNKLGIDIWHRKYQKNNETFDEWLDRIAKDYDEVKSLIKKKQFLPGGRILSNRGMTGSGVTYSNCYVVTPPDDSIESIYDSRKKLARTYSYGGGCGIDISKLAPAGATVNNQAEKTSGAVSFMDGYSKTTEEIGQNGRRGALMISLDCHHPDLMAFIDAKANADSITKANISVRVTNDFMGAVLDDRDWVMSFTRPETGEVITKTAKAKDIFNKLCENNHQWGEPGILFWDNICSHNLLANNPEFEYAGTNPCAEEPLPAGGSCLLGSMNLSEFVVGKSFDITAFNDAVKTAVIYLNIILEEGLPLHPLEEQRNAVENWRQIGLGIMGLADMFIKLGITYGSNEAVGLSRSIGRCMLNSALQASAELANLYGTYPKYTNAVLDTDFFKENANKETKRTCC